MTMRYAPHFASGHAKRVADIRYYVKTIKQYRKSFHDHDPSVHLRPDYQPPPSPEVCSVDPFFHSTMPIHSHHSSRYQEPPEWAKELQRGVFLLTQRVDSLGPKIDSIKDTHLQTMSPIDERKYYTREQVPSEVYTQTPLTQTVNIQTHPT